MVTLEFKHLKWMQETLARLQHDVTFLYFLEETRCRHCQQEKDLLAELCGLASKLHLETYNLVIDRELAERHGVDKVPGTVLIGRKDYGVRYFGVPSELEFRPFLEDVVMVSEGRSELSDRSKSRIATIEKPTHIEVLTTPACPFSGQAIRLAHQLAVENDRITGDMVDAREFPDLVKRYSILGAPTTVINHQYQFYGALNEEEFVEHVLRAVSAGH
jgi:glutaredoxin-like protein